MTLTDIDTDLIASNAVASPEFVVRRGKDRNYVMGHSRWSSETSAAAR